MGTPLSTEGEKKQLHVVGARIWIQFLIQLVAGQSRDEILERPLHCHASPIAFLLPDSQPA